jgi:hypothetical protein
LFELSRIEVNYWKDALARSTTKITEQVETLKKDKDLPAKTTPMLDELSNTASLVNFQLTELGKANSASTGITFSPGAGSLSLYPEKPRATSETLRNYPPQPPDTQRRFDEGR